MISIQKVSAANSVQVFGVSENTTDRTLTEFFENKLASAGCVGQIERTEYDKCRIIHFNNRKGIYL